MDPSFVRLHLDAPLGPGQPVHLSREAAHYLFTVMRLAPGATVAVFNGRDGEWLARVTDTGRRAGALTVETPLRPPAPPPDVWLLFAPLRKARTDFVVEKAVELGVARLVPVATERTNAGRVNADRLRAHAVEAAEQCGAVFVPAVAPMVPLAEALAEATAGRRLWWCDERLATGEGPPAFAPGPAAILIGPEGGFTDRERDRIAALPGSSAVRLGPRILRAETAALAALTLWQAAAGDWR
jgi:16S rRNA (uracil1498-N3)-methyltransferase